MRHVYWLTVGELDSLESEYTNTGSATTPKFSPVKVKLIPPLQLDEYCSNCASFSRERRSIVLTRESLSEG